MNVNLCDRFPALDPFRVRAQRFHDVLLIFRRLNDKANGKIPKGAYIKKGVLHKPATNDDWF